jgi:hypothetical protein
MMAVEPLNYPSPDQWPSFWYMKKPHPIIQTVTRKPKVYYTCLDLLNAKWIINLLDNLFYIEKHCPKDSPLFDIMITHVNYACFFPQIKAFLKDIPIDNLPSKLSPPYKFKKNLLKCRIPKIHEPDDIISGDDVKNFRRAATPYIILANIFSVELLAEKRWYLQKSVGLPYTQKQLENFINWTFYRNWNENAPIFDFSSNFKTSICLDPPNIIEQEEEAYFHPPGIAYIEEREESLQIFECIKSKAWLFLKTRYLLETLADNPAKFNCFVSKLTLLLLLLPC